MEEPLKESFYQSLGKAAPSQIDDIGRDLNPYEQPQLKAAETKRFQELMEFMAFKAIKKALGDLPKAVLEKLPYGRLSGDAMRQVESFCQDAFNKTVRKSVSDLLKAKAVKFSIKDVKEKAEDLLQEARGQIQRERAQTIKYTRASLAQDLVKARRRLRSLQARSALYERKISLWGDLPKARTAMADQLRRAEERLFELRKARVQEEAQLRQIYGGVLPTHVATSLYPAPPLPMLPASLLGDGLPEEPGIYFLWKDGMVEYVGQARKLNTRVRLKHHHILREHHTISYVQIEVRDLTWAECWYIGAMRPQRNFGTQASHYITPT